MTKIDDGGPAFPTPPHTMSSDRERILVDLGMSLRDYFAGRAMQTMVAGDGARMVASIDTRYDGKTGWDYIVAANAYEIADAMIEQRKKERTDDGGNSDGEVGGSDEGGRTGR